MKLLVTTTVCIITLINIAHADVSTFWSADAPGAYLYNASGAILNPAGLRVEMVIDQNNDTTFLGVTDFSGGYIGLMSDNNGWENMVSSFAVDDIVIDASSWFNPVGDVGAIAVVETVVPQAYANSSFYFRWFDSDALSTATQAGVIYGQGGTGGVSGWTVGDPLASPAIISSEGFLQYEAAAGNLGTDYTGVNGDGWQTVAPVPEPGTMALFALGLATLGASRRRRKVQA